MPRGGKRKGAGRPAGSRNKSTLARLVGKELQLEVLDDAELVLLCRDRAPEVVSILVEIARDPDAPAQARVNSASLLLSYGYGRPGAKPPADLGTGREWDKPISIVSPGDEGWTPPPEIPQLPSPEKSH